MGKSQPPNTQAEHKKSDAVVHTNDLIGTPVSHLMGGCSGKQCEHHKQDRREQIAAAGADKGHGACDSGENILRDA
jgi:hypothetical protein